MIESKLHRFNPKMLSWSREERHLDIPQVVLLMQELEQTILTAEDILLIENGKKNIRIQELEGFAVLYGQRLSTFFLAQPPPPDKDAHHPLAVFEIGHGKMKGILFLEKEEIS